MIDFAVIGTGWISKSFVTWAHKTLAWNLVGIYSRSAQTGQCFASAYSSRNHEQDIPIHTTLTSLCADPNIKAVHVASPNSFHYTQAKLILESRKHVILEKPAVPTLAELTDLYATAHKNNVYLLEALRHLREPSFHALRANLSRLGTLHGASLSCCNYSSSYDALLAGEKIPHNLSLEFAGGSLLDVGLYRLSMALALFGTKFSSKPIYTPIIIQSTGADGAGELLLRYPNFPVRIGASKIYRSTSPSEIYGENGTMILSGVSGIGNVEFLDTRSGVRSSIGDSVAPGDLVHEAREFARIIEEGDDEAVKYWERISLASVQVTETVLQENKLLSTADQI